MPCKNPCRLLHPSCIHIFRWSLQHSVKQRTLTGPPSSTNERAWSDMVSRALSLVGEVAPSLVSPHQGVHYINKTNRLAGGGRYFSFGSRKGPCSWGGTYCLLYNDHDAGFYYIMESPESRVSISGPVDFGTLGSPLELILVSVYNACNLSPRGINGLWVTSDSSCTAYSQLVTF